MSKQIQEIFTAIAPQYDFLNHFLSFSIDKQWRNRALRWLKLPPRARILDLCAGTLDLSSQLEKQFPGSSIVALDFCLAMLQQGSGKIHDENSVQRICADGHQMPFPDCSFDAIVCGFGIRNLDQRMKAVHEIQRLLVPGGKLLVLEFFRPETWLSKLFYRSYGKYCLPWFGGLISKNRQAYQYLQDSIQQFYSIDEYQKLLEQKQLKVLKTKALSRGIAHQILAEKIEAPC